MNINLVQTFLEFLLYFGMQLSIALGLCGALEENVFEGYDSLLFFNALCFSKSRQSLVLRVTLYIKNGYLKKMIFISTKENSLHLTGFLAHTVFPCAYEDLEINKSLYSRLDYCGLFLVLRGN